MFPRVCIVVYGLDWTNYIYIEHTEAVYLCAVYISTGPGTKATWRVHLRQGTRATTNANAQWRYILIYKHNVGEHTIQIRVSILYIYSTQEFVCAVYIATALATKAKWSFHRSQDTHTAHIYYIYIMRVKILYIYTAHTSYIYVLYIWRLDHRQWRRVHLNQDTHTSTNTHEQWTYILYIHNAGGHTIYIYTAHTSYIYVLYIWRLDQRQWRRAHLSKGTHASTNA